MNVCCKRVFSYWLRYLNLKAKYPHSFRNAFAPVLPTSVLSAVLYLFKFQGIYGQQISIVTGFDIKVLKPKGEQKAYDLSKSLPSFITACNVWYLNSVEMESLTGYQAVQKALSLTLVQDPSPVSTVVHFKVSAQGITLTDNQRK